MSKHELKLIIEVNYAADPVHYSDDGSDVTAAEMARIDADQFNESPELLAELIEYNQNSLSVTVVPA